MRVIVIAAMVGGCAGGAIVPNHSARSERAPLVEHAWPSPERLPELPPHATTRVRPVIVVPQLGPKQPEAATRAERDRLARVAATTKGPARLAALDRLADALEADAFEEPFDDAMQARTDRAIAAYRQLVAEPGFASYAKADEVLVRAGHLMLFAGHADEGRVTLVELVSKYGSSPYAGDAYVMLADDVLATDPVAARADLEEAIAIGRGPIVDYAHVRHAEALVALGEYRGALAECEQVAAVAALRDAAAWVAVTAYVHVEAPSGARAYFTRLDPEHAPDDYLLELAHTYRELDLAHDGLAVLDDVIAHATDPELICSARFDELDLQPPVGNRTELLVAARALAEAAVRAPGCRVSADERLGELAWTWQHDKHATGRDVDAMWALELAVVTTDARRAAALRARAVLAWWIAQTERRFDPAAWDAAAAAFEAANAATPDRDLADAVTAARANARTLRTSP